MKYFTVIDNQWVAAFDDAPASELSIQDQMLEILVDIANQLRRLNDKLSMKV